MSVIEAAIKKLQSTRNAGQPGPAPAYGTVVSAAARRAEGATTSATPARRLVIDQNALRAAGLLPPEQQEKPLAQQYRHIKRPLIASALGHGTQRLTHGNLIMLVIVGEDRPYGGGPSLRAGLESLADSLAVRDAVRFVGPLADPMPAIVSADVCLLVSETEGLSNSIIEYMVAARPVVCTKVGGNAELVTDGQTGYLVAVGDVNQLAASIIGLLQNADRAHAFGAEGRRRALELFAPAAMVARHMKLYAGMTLANRHA